MRLRGIADDAAANAYADEAYLPAWDASYAVMPASAVDYHLPRNPALRDEDVFCLEHTRTVGNDFVVQFGKRGLQLDRAARGRVPAGSKVIVRESQDGTLRVIRLSRVHGERECRWTPATARTRKPELPAPPPRPDEARKPNRPGPYHPWRRPAAPKRAAA
jgi:hypothetical protein